MEGEKNKELKLLLSQGEKTKGKKRPVRREYGVKTSIEEERKGQASENHSKKEKECEDMKISPETKSYDVLKRFPLFSAEWQ